MPPEMMVQARADLRAWPVYEPTPLVDLPGLASMLGVASIRLKDESQRRPLESFKALGGAYALAEAIRDKATVGGTRPTYDDLWSGALADIAREFRVAAASDGNHGLSLAWGAQLLGCPCTIYLPWNVPDARADLITAFGASVVRVDGNYEAAVAAAFADTTRDGHVLIQDTSFPGYVEHCRRIMAGYTLMSEEIRDALGSAPRPSHVFLQVGCGGMAAAVAADLWLHWEAARPKIVVVEALNAASIYESLKSRALQVVEGNLDTIMIGISCGEVSLLAWDILEECADHAVAIPDEPAIEAMQLLARGVANDQPLTIGETGVAGLAALIESLRSPDLSANLQLGSDSHILLIGSEGAVDRVAYDSFIRTAAVAE